MLRHFSNEECQGPKLCADQPQDKTRSVECTSLATYKICCDGTETEMEYYENGGSWIWRPNQFELNHHNALMLSV